jgi:hypothetical protein
MRTNVFFAMIVLSGFVFVATSQIELQPNGTLNIGTYNNSRRYTYHYGNLNLLGGVGGTTWGWFRSTRAAVSYGMTVEGNLSVTQNAIIAGGLNIYSVKSFLSPHPTDATKFIRYAAMESGEALTVTQGVAKTVDGQATVALPEHFSLVTNKDEPITVAITPEGAPVLLYAKQKSTTEIVIAMSSSDLKKYKDVGFSYLVTGVRDGFEKLDVVVNEDRLDSPSLARDDVQKRIDAYAAKKKAEQELELSNKRKAAAAIQKRGE